MRGGFRSSEYSCLMPYNMQSVYWMSTELVLACEVKST